MEILPVSKECEETEATAPNSQNAFSPQNQKRHKLNLVESLLKTLLWEKTLEVMQNSSHQQSPTDATERKTLRFRKENTNLTGKIKAAKSTCSI